MSRDHRRGSHRQGESGGKGRRLREGGGRCAAGWCCLERHATDGCKQRIARGSRAERNVRLGRNTGLGLGRTCGLASVREGCPQGGAAACHRVVGRVTSRHDTEDHIACGAWHVHGRVACQDGSAGECAERGASDVHTCIGDGTHHCALIQRRVPGHCQGVCIERRIVQAVDVDAAVRCRGVIDILRAHGCHRLPAVGDGGDEFIISIAVGDADHEDAVAASAARIVAEGMGRNSLAGI